MSFLRQRISGLLSRLNNREADRDYIRGKAVVVCKVCGRTALGSDMIDAIDGKIHDPKLAIRLRKLKQALSLNRTVLSPIYKKVKEKEGDTGDEKDTLIGVAIYSHLTRNHKVEFVKFVDMMAKDIRKAYKTYFDMPDWLEARLFDVSKEG